MMQIHSLSRNCVQSCVPPSGRAVGSLPALPPARVSRGVSRRLRAAYNGVSQREGIRGRLQLLAASSFDLDALGLDIPDIDGDATSIQRDLGALVDEAGIAQSFGNTEAALDALGSGVAVADLSHWGRLRLTGDDRLQFLHNQSTNAFTELQPGQGTDTVFVTATARTLDLATALVGERHVLLIVSPERKALLRDRFERFIFPGDDVQITDVSGQCAMFTLAGPGADDLLSSLGGPALTILGAPRGAHQLLSFKAGKGPVLVSVGSQLASPGYTLIADESVAGDLYAALTERGAVPMGEEDWQRARVLQGRPAPGLELTEEVNPLEAGLWRAVSLEKGCYIGQETLAKVARLNAVKQQLWGLQLTKRCEPGTDVVAEVSRIGRVTSVADLPGGKLVALAFLRCKSGGAQVDLEGVLVSVDGAPATVTSVPFLSTTFPEGANAQQPASSSSGSTSVEDEALKARSEDARRQKEAEAAAEEAAKQQRLQALKDKLAAWQAQQQR